MGSRYDGGHWWSAVARGGQDEFISAVAEDVGFGRGGRGRRAILILRPLMAEFARFCHCAVEWVVIWTGVMVFVECRRRHHP